MNEPKVGAWWCEVRDPARDYDYVIDGEGEWMLRAFEMLAVARIPHVRALLCRRTKISRRVIVAFGCAPLPLSFTVPPLVFSIEESAQNHE